MSRVRRMVVLASLAMLFLIVAFALSKESTEVPDDAHAKSATTTARRPAYPRDERVHRDRAPPPKGDDIEDNRIAASSDALQRALLAPGGAGAFFIEVNALRHAPLVEKIFHCRASDGLEGLSALQENLGVDPRRDLDRIGSDGNVLAATGFFEDLKIPEALGAGVAYGDNGRVWQEPNEGAWFARVGDDLVLSAPNEGALKDAIDRAEGRAATGPPLALDLLHSESYGTFTQEMLAGLMSGGEDVDEQGQAAKLVSLVEKADVRMNVGEDVALSLDVRADAEDGELLAEGLRGVVALVRRQAEARGEEDVARLLQDARISSQGAGQLAIDIAVPGAFLLKGLGCDAEGNPGDPVPVEMP